MPRIDVGHVTLTCADMGECDAFVFIPGLVGLSDAWSFQLDHFAKRYRCITFDHRGTGDSDKPTGPEAYSTQAIADDVIVLMDTLGIDKAHIVGTSTGGCVLTRCRHSSTTRKKQSDCLKHLSFKTGADNAEGILGCRLSFD